MFIGTETLVTQLVYERSRMHADRTEIQKIGLHRPASRGDRGGTTGATAGASVTALASIFCISVRSACILDRIGFVGLLGL